MEEVFRKFTPAKDEEQEGRKGQKDPERYQAVPDVNCLREEEELFFYYAGENCA